MYFVRDIIIVIKRNFLKSHFEKTYSDKIVTYDSSKMASFPGTGSLTHRESGPRVCVCVCVCTRQTAELQLPQPAGVVERRRRGVPVVVGHHQQSVPALFEVLAPDQPQVDQRDVRRLVHGDQNVAADFLDGLKKDRQKTEIILCL